MAEQKVVGTAVPRGEGGGKVSGATVYAADVKLPGLLWAKFLRSPHPHAYIRNVDISKAEKVHGVRAIITGADVKGFLIGKQPGCDLLIEDGYTSSMHAQISMDDAGVCKLYDRGSTNGTYVNGVRVADSALQNGITIRIGSTEIRFLAE